MKVAITNCPLWTNITPNYPVSLLGACLHQKGFDVVYPELEINFYHHISPDERLYWLSTNGDFWDSDDGPGALFAKYRTSFFTPFAEGLKEQGIGVLALSVNNRALSMTRELVKLVKETAQDIHIILGGPTSYSNPHLLWEMEGVNAVCIGEGDISLPSYLEHLSANGLPLEFMGFAIKSPDGSITNGGASPVIGNLDELPFPDYTQLNMELYPSKKVIPTALSRGCIQRCSYCAESPSFGKFRSRSGASLFSEISKHMTDLGLDSINILLNDSLINGSVDVLVDFADRIKESNLKVEFNGMAIAHKGMTPDVLSRLRDAGCKGLSYGIESGSKEVLQMMHKRMHTPESSEIVLRDTKAAGIHTTVYIIVGFPGETESHFYETLQFLRRNIDNIDTLMVNHMLILNGSFVQRHPDKYGLDPEHTSGGRFRTLDGHNTFEIRRMRQRLLHLLFEDKIITLDNMDDGLYNPSAIIKSRNDQIVLMNGQIDLMRQQLESKPVKIFLRCWRALKKVSPRPLRKLIRSLLGW